MRGDGPNIATLRVRNYKDIRKTIFEVALQRLILYS